MNLEYYNLTITGTTLFKFTNVYRHLSIINNDTSYSVTIKQGERVLFVVKPLQSITLLDVFDTKKDKDHNPVFTLIAESGGFPMNIEIYNYGV